MGICILGDHAHLGRGKVVPFYVTGVFLVVWLIPMATIFVRAYFHFIFNREQRMEHHLTGLDSTLTSSLMQCNDILIKHSAVQTVI